MLPGGIAFSLQIFGCIDAALGTDGVGTLHGDDGKQVDVSAHFRDLDDGSEPRQSAADDYDFRICCHLSSNFNVHEWCADLSASPKILVRSQTVPAAAAAFSETR